MATALASKGGFQLCEKRTTYVRVSGVMSQVWGPEKIIILVCCRGLTRIRNRTVVIIAIRSWSRSIARCVPTWVDFSDLSKQCD